MEKGETMTQLPKHEGLEIEKFARIFDSMSTSYKAYWFYAIFEEVCKGRSRFTFREIAIRMCIKAWYSCIEYKLSLGVIDQISLLITLMKNKYGVESKFSDEKKYELISNHGDVEIEKKLYDLVKYVPYRLLSPFVPKLTGLSDAEKNIRIEKYCVENKEVLYKISTENDIKKIEITPKWFEYIYLNQVIIRGWIEHNLVTYLTRRNPNIPGISNKISAPTSSMRSLTTQTKFWKDVMRYGEIENIYTGEFVKDSELSIDHFIPWSFVLHNELWNLAPISRSINSQKSDKLPSLEVEFDKFKSVQFHAVSLALSKKFGKKMLEDYYIVFRELLTAERLKKESFYKGLEDTILPIYQIAQNQGFEIWNR